MKFKRPVTIYVIPPGACIIIINLKLAKYSSNASLDLLSNFLQNSNSGMLHQLLEKLTLDLNKSKDLSQQLSALIPVLSKAEELWPLLKNTITAPEYRIIGLCCLQKMISHCLLTSNGSGPSDYASSAIKINSNHTSNTLTGHTTSTLSTDNTTIDTHSTVLSPLGAPKLLESASEVLPTSLVESSVIEDIISTTAEFTLKDNSSSFQLQVIKLFLTIVTQENLFITTVSLELIFKVYNRLTGDVFLDSFYFSCKVYK